VVKNIPEKIHQVWLGSEFPADQVKYSYSWKYHNPSWEYKLWTDSDVKDVDIPNRKLFDSITNLGQKSDFLRYHILKQYGGIYVDTDFECLKGFENLPTLDFFTGVGYPKDVELYVGIIVSVPNHPILNHIIECMTEARYEGSWRNMFHTTGSYFFTRMFFDMVNEHTEGIVAFPPDFFYPFPNNMKKEKVDPYSFVKSISYAIHHWAVSWRAKK
jgi:mannosyltransferase OCH1-like enzyme